MRKNLSGGIVPSLLLHFQVAFKSYRNNLLNILLIGDVIIQEVGTNLGPLPKFMSHICRESLNY